MDPLNDILTNVARCLLETFRFAIRRIASFLLSRFANRNIPSLPPIIMTNSNSDSPLAVDTSFGSTDGDAVDNAAFGATPTNTRPNSQAVATPRSHKKNAKLQLADLTPAQRVEKGMELQYAKQVTTAEFKKQTTSKWLASRKTDLDSSKAYLADLVKEEEEIREQSGLPAAECALTKALQEFDLAKANVTIANDAVADATRVFNSSVTSILVPKLVAARDDVRNKQDAYDRALNDDQDADEKLAKSSAAYNDFRAGCPDE